MKKSKFSFKDVVVILLSIVALAALVFVLKYAKEAEERNLEELNNINNAINSGIYNDVSGALNYIVINEVNESGWIEFYNSGKDDVDINGISVCVNGEQKYTVTESTIIDSGTFFVSEVGQELLAQDIIGMYDGDGNSVLHMQLPELSSGESYGAVYDGDIAFSYMTETKGFTNTEAQVIDKEKLLFSVKGGFYPEAFDLKLYAPEGYTIYYTTDGTDPTTESTVYSGYIRIANRSGSNFTYAKKESTGYYAPTSLDVGTVVRAIMVDAAGTVVEEKTESYYIALAGSSEYLNMPVISITTDPKNLFDYFEGMYIQGRSYEDAIAKGENTGMAANYHQGWVKEAYIEFFEADKDKTYEGKVNISIINDYAMGTGQKSFRIEGVNAGEGSCLSIYLEGDSDTVLLQTNQYDNNYKLRELVAKELFAGLDAGMASMQPCTLFIDGEYWGGYLLRDKYDEEYIRNNYGIGEEKVVIVQDGVVNNYAYNYLYEEFQAFVIENDMSIQQNYELVKNKMDIQNYLDYFCASMYVANSGFRSMGVLWRTVGTTGDGYCDGKWRWEFTEMDATMDNGMAGNRTTSSIDTLLQPTVTQNAFLQSLLMNSEFRNQLKATMVKMAEERFTEENVSMVLEDVSGYIQKFAIGSYKRFYGNVTNDYYASEIRKIENFFAERKEYILIYTDELVEQGGDMGVILAARAELEAERLEKELAEELEKELEGEFEGAEGGEGTGDTENETGYDGVS